MTRKEAMEYNDSLKKELEQAALECGLEKTVGAYIADNFPIAPDMDTVNNCFRVVEERAKMKGIPIFVFLDRSILNILPIWKKNNTADFSEIVDSPKIFEFVDTLRNKDSNWVHEFNSGKDIIDCLRKQMSYLANDCLCLRQHFHKERVSPKVLQYSGRVFELAVEKPDAWEYLLFAAALKDNPDKLDDLRYDMKYGITFKNAILYDEPKEIIDFVQMKCGEIG